MAEYNALQQILELGRSPTELLAIPAQYRLRLFEKPLINQVRNLNADPFAFLALPPLTSLYLTERLRLVFVISAIIGTLSATLGYFFSFVLSIPTGASMTVCASVFFIMGIVWREVKIRT